MPTLGVTFYPHGLSYSTVATLGQLAEDQGFDGVFVVEQRKTRLIGEGVRIAIFRGIMLLTVLTGPQRQSLAVRSERSQLRSR